MKIIKLFSIIFVFDPKLEILGRLNTTLFTDLLYLKALYRINVHVELSISFPMQLVKYETTFKAALNVKISELYDKNCIHLEKIGTFCLYIPII